MHSRFFRLAGIQQPEVEGMTHEAVRSKIRNDNFKNAIRLQPAIELLQLWYLEPFLILEIRFTQNIDLAEP